MKNNFPKRVTLAKNSIRRLTDFTPDFALVTGTGLAGLLEKIDIEITIPYENIKGFPVSTAPGHKGELIFGHIGGTKVVAQNGRFHLYEGWDSDDIVLPVYVLRALGASTYIVTNAAGALNAEFAVADIMLIKDHINFMGAHPLAGPNDDQLGARFPDMSRAYCPDLIRAAIAAAQEIDIDLRSGIYTCVRGPELETSAERRFLTMAGGDAVGMSTVPEVIAANHCGLKVLGFSAITNQATGGDNQQPDTLQDILANADKAAAKLRALITRLLSDNSFIKRQA